MARSLTQLPKTAFSGLDYDNILQDVINLVKDNPNYNENWDDFLSSDAGRMLVEIFAYIADQLATRIDWVVNENYLSTATQKQSVIRLLKIIGYNFTLPRAASVYVNVYTANYPGPYYLTEVYDSGEGTLTPFTLNVINTRGVSTTFELLDYDSVLDKYNYKVGVEVDSSEDVLTFYEGKTYVEDFTATTDNGYSFTLSNYPVIENSIIIYFVNGSVEEEMLEVSSFIDPEAQNEQDDDSNDYGVPYVLEVNEDESVTVLTGTTALLPNANRRLATDDVVKVFYRTGGGVAGNIPARSINTSRTLSVELVAGGDTIVQLSGGPTGTGLVNTSQGTGGAAGETASHAATYAPLQIRTSNKAVSAEDYDTILNSHADVLTAKVYGNSNSPSTVFEEYGVYLNPFDVWIYVTPNISSWESYNPSRYNDLEWISLRLQNMFNNIHSFRTGAFNDGDSYANSEIQGKTLQGDTIDYDGNGDTYFKNYLIFDPPDAFKEAYSGNSSARIKITTSADTEQNFENLSDVLVGELKVGDTPGDSVLRLKGDTCAYFQSFVDIEAGVDLSVEKWIRISIDDSGDTSIDLSNGAIDISSVKPDEIAAAINYKLANLTGYGGLYGDSSTGKIGVASIVRPTTSTSYIKITSPVPGDSSNIYFLNNSVLAGDSDATEIIFGSSVSGDTYACYGYRRLTFITNSTESNYQKIIYENGSINLNTDPDAFYVHYLLSEGDTIELGDYFYDTYGGSSPNDPLWRNKATRIYNTVEYGDTGDSIDPYSSNFELRFTKASTTSMSIYNITEDWNFTEAVPPRMQSTSAIIGTDGDTVIGLTSAHYCITFNIDGLGDTYVDVTGDSGLVGDTYGYPIDTVIDNINTKLQVIFGALGGEPYDTFTYAKRGDTYTRRLVIESPTATNNSYIAIKPIGDTNYAWAELNLATEDGDSHYWYPIGDYYLWYNSTRDAMDLIKLHSTQMSSGDTPEISNMPDDDFYIHFIWDRRNETGLGENTYQLYLQNSKIIGVENVFRQTRFTPFYITGTVYYNENYSRAIVKEA
ncbi:MAG: hypothetical protein PHQ86_02730, partial [Dehalococcoidales bacterium]|nr:hypothetical protein [Dehalococcoidales bacterium]